MWFRINIYITYANPLNFISGLFSMLSLWRHSRSSGNSADPNSWHWPSLTSIWPWESHGFNWHALWPLQKRRFRAFRIFALIFTVWRCLIIGSKLGKWTYDKPDIVQIVDWLPHNSSEYILWNPCASSIVIRFLVRPILEHHPNRIEPHLIHLLQNRPEIPRVNYQQR